MKTIIFATILVLALFQLALGFGPVGLKDPMVQIFTHAKDSSGMEYLENTVVYFIVTSPTGQKLGFNPNTNQAYNDFSEEDAGYGTEGIDLNMFAEAMLKPTSGGYTIQVIGSDLVMFSVVVLIDHGVPDEKTVKLETNGVIDKGLTTNFQFIYNSDPSQPAGTISRIATSSSLKQDITLSRKIGWIDNDGIMKSLLAKADAIEASIAKGNKTAAKNQLNAFINEVNAQKGKHISDKAIKIVLEDAQYLLESL